MLCWYDCSPALCADVAPVIWSSSLQFCLQLLFSIGSYLEEAGDLILFVKQ